MSAAGNGLLQQVVLPVVHDPDSLPLYVDADYWSSLPLYESRDDKEQQRGFVREDTDHAVIRLSDFGVLSAIRGRKGFVVPHRRRVSFGTYFNAFPASYWRNSTDLTSVRLRIATRGTGQVLVSRSNARGVTQRVESAAVSGEVASEFLLDFTNFGDGGWYWFDLVAEDDDFELVDAGWYDPADEPAPAGSVSLAITTLNRVSYCLDMLATLAADAEVLALIDRVNVVDQGSDRIMASPRFSEVDTAFAGKLRVIEQANLGGSGGFSRGMYEALEAGESDYVLLLDDDIAIEPESVRRAVRFADHAITPTIVGGHMFDMYDKSKLHAFAEGFDKTNFVWGATTPTRHDFSSANLRQTRWMHRRIDSQYNGWWMCLIPTSVVREIGLSLPVFIKWDDAEYGLRAAAHGVPTVSLPGAAVWHVSWVDKDDSIDWQAFFHARNRLVAALLHSPRPRGGRLTRANLAIDMKHVFALQYFAAAARIEAYRSILGGPESLHGDMVDRLPRTRQLMSQFPDANLVKERGVLPEAHADSAIEEGRWAPVYAPRGIATVRWLMRVTWRNVMKQADESTTARPQAAVPFNDARWWIIGHYDSVIVTNAEGSGHIWYRRDRKRFFQLTREAWKLRRRIQKQWPELSRRYREALPDIVSVEQWKRSFGLDES
ncbi:glycosyltransferase [Schumannella sp. 10F1B-5-1]|uniref:glycosyltransferase n=1 Tax=Schumannella sp. 10F1B-5-1 TaxID=2590780 RepID=UPI0011318C35|nr:glycosyltransferase [Schumannella sp. 10F1B-5-1]TPW73564.1 glycosyltransferase family 2 protein [Schumannella sp. 10F1B-5-1]